MTSADFSQQILFQPCFILRINTSVRPPRVRAITFIPPICCIYFEGSGQYRTSFCQANSSNPLKPYAVSVRQTGILPPASFRPHLAMDTLAFS